MKKWNDFFSEETPAGHDERVRNAVAQSLMKNKEAQPNWRSVLSNWKTLTMASGSLAAILVLLWKQDVAHQDQAEVASFQALIDTNNVQESTEDLNLMADDSFDLEFLEDLEFIEQMEDV